MNLFVKGEYGRVMTITPEELKEKLGITFDIVALGIEVNDGESAWLPKAMRCRLAR